jgi:hypothetical protein
MTRPAIASDEDMRGLVEVVCKVMPSLNFIEARWIIERLDDLGYLKYPDAHPSGLATSESATTELVPSPSLKSQIAQVGRILNEDNQP